VSQPVHGATLSGNVPYPAVWLAAACLALGAFLARGYLSGMFEPQDGSALQPWMFGAFAALALHSPRCSRRRRRSGPTGSP
jgi:hypothetical protein